MKQLTVVFFAFFVASLISLTSGVAAFAAPRITNFDATYHLGRDSENRSTLDVTERITTEFQPNKNKGIVRTIPKNYDGHSVSFKLKSVTRNGAPEPLYDQRTDGGMHVIETGTDNYINGTQVFEFKYTLRDVTRYFANTGKDEFYWDTNGTGWPVGIDHLTASLSIDAALRSALTGNNSCYQGQYGRGDACVINKTTEGFSVAVDNLAAGENVTIAAGFAPNTFAAYQQSLQDKLYVAWLTALVVTSIIGLIVIFWLTSRAHKWKNRSSEVGTIVPEYIPPKNASIATSSAILGGLHANGMAAQLTDLAVRHYIQILETKEKSFLSPAQYDLLVIKDISDLRAEEQEILNDIFDHKPAVNERIALKTLQSNASAYLRFSDNPKKIRDLIRNDYKLESIDQAKRRWFNKTAIILLIFSIATLSPVLFVATIIAFTYSKTLWVLSDEGLALSRYLKGLELYIKVAEQDRIKMLQSPEGATKVDIKDATNPAQLVKLYEKVLPYAILFNQEKEWTKRLGNYYSEANTSPDWYTGQSAFNAAAFGGMVSNFSNSVNTTSASSSSSGGSSGGGFSGGGGGGGGGGFR